MKKSIWTGESLDGLFKQDIFLTDVMERCNGKEQKDLLLLRKIQCMVTL